MSETYWYSHLTVPEFHRILWVLGPTGSGKSTVARKICSQTGAMHREASMWLRRMHSPTCGVEALTATAVSILQKDERYFSRLIQEDIERCTQEAGSRIVLSGARNPIDFVDNFDVHLDGALVLSTRGCPPQSGFERAGLESIQAYLRFAQEVGLLLPRRVALVEPDR